MKIKVTSKSYEEVCALPKMVHKSPRPQLGCMRALVHILSKGELKKVHFTNTDLHMDRIQKDEPCLYLMNHSSFIDLKIAFRLISPKPFHIVCTSDGFVGKEKLMRALGCIPAVKFVTDLPLVMDIRYCLKELKSSVLMYPEASYSFDGTETPLPESLGKFIKMLKVPVVLIKTEGAFLRDPLYNGLRLRETSVSAVTECLFTADEVKKCSVREINEVLRSRFTYDHFHVQREKRIPVTEAFRAEGLERALYKCPVCRTEGKMKGTGTDLVCLSCGKKHFLDEYGVLHPEIGSTGFASVPEWYRWEREEVRNELIGGTYHFKVPVTIRVMADMKSIYTVGKGVLEQTACGISLKGCDGKLSYTQSARASYSLYADFFWYELGDMICIGDTDRLYYCFPEDPSVPVAKARLAAEEAYKLCE